MITKLRITAVAIFGALATACASGGPSPDNAGRLYWMVGCWQSLDGANREVWSTPTAGIMFGNATTVNNGQLAFFEQSRIMLNSTPATYVVSPNGQRAATFVENRAAPRPEDGFSAVFENAQNEFPQRIAYRTNGRDGLSATISLLDGSRATNYNWERCGS